MAARANRSMKFCGFWGDAYRQIQIHADDSSSQLKVGWIGSIFFPPEKIGVRKVEMTADGALQFETTFPKPSGKQGGSAVWTCTLDGAGTELSCNCVNYLGQSGKVELRPIQEPMPWKLMRPSTRKLKWTPPERTFDRRQAMMLVAVNGRDLYQPLAPSKELMQAELPSAAVVIEALRREAELRKAPLTLRTFMDPQADDIGVIRKIQKQVGKEFELGPFAEQIIQCAQTLYPDCSAMREIPHYVKYNRARQGKLSKGAPIPRHLMLQKLCGASVPITSLIKSEETPLILVAGSIT